MRRLVIKPFPTSKMDEQQALSTWNSLESAIAEIHNKNASSLSFEELYRFAYNLVLHKRGDMLYNGVRETVAAQLRVIADRLARTPDDQLLADLSSAWLDHSTMMEMVRDLLMYMDRNYVKPKRKVPIYDCGLTIFRDCVVRDERIHARIQTILLGNVERERGGAVVDQLLLKETLEMLIVLGVKTRYVYARDFEAPFLAQTRRFYQRESMEYLSEGVPAYLTMAKRRLEEEARRVVAYLHASSEAPLRHCTEDELVITHAARLVEMEGSGVTAMLKGNRVAELRMLYALFRSVGRRAPHALAALRDALGAHVEAEGTALVTASQAARRGGGSRAAGSATGGDAAAPATGVGGSRERAVALVDGIITMQRRYDVLLASAFDGDIAFGTALKEAFESFINASRNPAVCLSLYADHVLRRSQRSVGIAGSAGRADAASSGASAQASGGAPPPVVAAEADDDAVTLDDRLSRVITIFRYVREKDVFESHYKEQLCRRLLDAKASTDDADERRMISKLQTENGYQYTAKMEGMFKDVRMARDLNGSYQKWCCLRLRAADAVSSDGGESGAAQSGGSSNTATTTTTTMPETGLSVQVLTTGFWPPRLIRRGGLAVDSASTRDGGGGSETMTAGEGASLASGAPSSGCAATSSGTASLPLVPSPRSLTAARDAFAQFYAEQHSGRRLEWQMQMGTAQLKFDLGRSRPLELDVSTYVALFLFPPSLPHRHKRTITIHMMHMYAHLHKARLVHVHKSSPLAPTHASPARLLRTPRNECIFGIYARTDTKCAFSFASMAPHRT